MDMSAQYQGDSPPTQVQPDRIKYIDADREKHILYDIENGDAWVESTVTVKDLFGDGR